MDSSQNKTMSEKAQSVIDNLKDKGAAIQDRVSAAFENGRDRAVDCARATDRTIRDKPYQAIGIALALGVITGMLINRDRD